MHSPEYSPHNILRSERGASLKVSRTLDSTTADIIKCNGVFVLRHTRDIVKLGVQSWLCARLYNNMATRTTVSFNHYGVTVTRLNVG